ATAGVPDYLRCPDGHRELRFLNKLVKRYSTEAESQETILRAFRRRRWVRQIPNPLPRELGRNPKKRLHDAIDRLNRNQINSLLRFHGDGNGMAVYWEATADVADSMPIARRQPADSLPVDGTF